MHDRLYAQLTSTSMDAVFVLDRHGKILDANTAATAMYGYSRDELLALSLRDLEARETPTEIERHTAEVMARGKDRFESCHYHKNGSIIDVEVSTTFVAEAEQFLVFLRDISARKQANSQLAQSHNLLQFIINAAPIRVFWKNRDLVYLGCNRAFARDTGADDPAAIVGKDDYQLGWKDQAELYREDDRQVIDNGVSKLFYEEPQTTPDGKQIWLNTSKVPLRDEHDQIIGVLGVYADITEQRQVAEKLRETQELFRLFLRHTPVYTFIKQIEGTSSRVVELSDNFIDMLGRPADELRGCTMEEMFPPEFARKMTADDIAVIEAGEVIQLDEEFNGHSYITIKFPIIRPGQPSLLAGYTIDVTERRNAEAALKLNEERTLSLLKLNQMTDASLQELTDFALEEAVRLTKSSIGYLAFMNTDESVLTMHAWSKAAMVECSIIDKPIHYPIEATGLWGEAVRQRRPVITNDYGAPNPLKRGYPAGHVQVMRHLNVPIFDGARIVLVAGVGNKSTDYDLTDVQQLTLLMDGMWRLLERKRVIEERLELERQLLHSQKLESLGVLAGGIAHDFNNILTAIVGNTELALMHLPPQSPIADNLLRIEKAASRATDLARQMLAYSGRGKFVIESIDLNHLIEEMGRILEVSIPKKVALRYQLAAHLPPIQGDATQIRQVVMNLVINAAEAIGETDGEVTITTGCTTCDSAHLKEIWHMDPLAAGVYIFLEVTDTGCGMSRDVFDKLFDPFFTTKFTGRGLGMAAVLGIVRGHHGAITVQTEEGKGSTFRILLPASLSGQDAEVAPDSTEELRASGTVLLVDDEETVLEIGTAMLETLGYRVITAGNGVEALDRYREHHDITLVILDLTMPQMDGMQCFKALQALNPEVRVVMSSGFNEQEVTKQLDAQGLSGFIQKPYRLADLKSVLARG
jgi:PAS domain S-box-containing protein